MIWKLASGLPNCVRSSRRSSAASYPATAWPSAVHAHVARVPASTRAVSAKDCAPGSRFAAGTRTPSSVMWACQTARSDPLPSMTLAS